MSLLYLVATPIGNLDDITFRAVRILKEVPLIAAEDTRTTKTLLSKYEIETPLTSYHDHNKENKTPVLLDHLQKADLALVSDAGTPGINDPGFYLIKAALAEGHNLIPIPGPSAPIAALSASGMPTDSFLYLGYLPRKTRARLKMAEEIQAVPWTLVCLETPHRLVDALVDLQTILGNRQVVVVREMTKIHEEIIRGSLREVIDYYQKSPPKGEITLILEGKNKPEIMAKDDVITIIRQKIDSESYSPTELAKSLAEETGWSRRDIYDLMQKLQDKLKP